MEKENNKINKILLTWTERVGVCGVLVQILAALVLTNGHGSGRQERGWRLIKSY